MSEKHPIIAVTGSSGSGTSDIKHAFEEIFERQKIRAAMISGDGFHRYDRQAMQEEVANSTNEGEITHFGPSGNLFGKLEGLFARYAEKGSGKYRHYVHDSKDEKRYGRSAGSLTPWISLPEKTDLLFYEGLHGALVTSAFDIACHVDLLVGVAPTINLEWIQKIHRDRASRGYTTKEATKIILDRIPDYAHYIVPQFSRTDINFQRVPTIDTSNPFAATAIPSHEESISIVHVRNIEKLSVDFGYLLKVIGGSFMSNAQTIVVPAQKNRDAINLILAPLIQRMVEKARAIKPRP